MQFQVGEKYFVRTVTDYWVGRLVSVDGPYTLTLTDAAWVANTGRLSEFVGRGWAEGAEVEPVGRVTCQWLAVLPWSHDLFPEAK